MGANFLGQLGTPTDGPSLRMRLQQDFCDGGDHREAPFSGLEIVCGETHRGFKSHPLRQKVQVKGHVVGGSHLEVGARPQHLTARSTAILTAKLVGRMWELGVFPVYQHAVHCVSGIAH
jgi:hypothetical protein